MLKTIEEKHGKIEFVKIEFVNEEKQALE